LARPRGQTLQQRFGFLDGNLKAPAHNEIMLWLTANIDWVIIELFWNSARPARKRREVGLVGGLLALLASRCTVEPQAHILHVASSRRQGSFSSSIPYKWQISRVSRPLHWVRVDPTRISRAANI